MWSLTPGVAWQTVQEQKDNAQGLVSPSLSEGNLSVTVSRGLTIITEQYNTISGVYRKRVLYRGPWSCLYGWRISVVTCICIWENSLSLSTQRGFKVPVMNSDLFIIFLSPRQAVRYCDNLWRLGLGAFKLLLTWYRLIGQWWLVLGWKVTLSGVRNGIKCLCSLSYPVSCPMGKVVWSVPMS